jgi:haloalkane dehalogenase
MNKDTSLPKISVLDSEMAYREAGSRDAPVALFLHGNPTSSYIWRNIIPIVAPVAHCIAPDLIGFGQSSKPDIAYRFEDHARYLDAFIAEMGIGSTYLVVQDWGSGLAFRLAQRRPISCAASPSWSSSGRSQLGRSSCAARKRARFSASSERPAKGRN